MTTGSKVIFQVEKANGLGAEHKRLHGMCMGLRFYAAE